MKRKHILIASVALMATSFLESCSDEFLQDKKNHDYASPQDAYNNYSGALARVNDIYKFIMPDVKGAPSFNTTVRVTRMRSLSRRKNTVVLGLSLILVRH